MSSPPYSGRRLFVLDTTVLLHDPTALFRFQEHDIYIPISVLEELDQTKRGVSELARNARQVSRFLDELVKGAGPSEMEAGLPLTEAATAAEGARGRLFFHAPPKSPRETRPFHGPSQAVLDAAHDLQSAHPAGRRVTVVTKDINLRVKAAVVGIHAEDYYSDQVLDDLDLLYAGALPLPSELCERAIRLNDRGSAPVYELELPADMLVHPNEFVYAAEGDSGFEARVLTINAGKAAVSPVADFRDGGREVWGVHARNREQNFALNMLMDPEMDFVSLLGAAGTGKTLLTLAAGLSQTLDEQRYSEIIMTRVTVPLGEDIGYLPGTEEEKMTPWMGALMDNLEVLAQPAGAGSWGRAATEDMIRSRIKIRSLNFMRGRTFLNKLIILDEAQNLTAKQMKALITRAGPGTKIVAMGNIAQIDTPYLTESSSGLTYVVDRFKAWPHGGHITLLRGERSRLADFATENL